MPTLSIIIPVYNVAQYLRQCIDSILASSFTAYELILVDDGSTDDSGSICDEYAKKDSRVIVIHQVNGGVSKARNTGIDNAHAPWIVFIDADDWISSTFLANLFKAVEEHPDTDFVHASFTNYRNGTIAEVARHYDPYYGSDMNHLCPIYFGRPYAKLYRLEILKNVRFDEHVSCSEDLLFTADYLAHVNKYVLLSEVGYYYRCDNPSSIWHAPRVISYAESLHFFNHQFDATKNLVINHQISRGSASFRYTQVADSLVNAIYTLYRNQSLSKQQRLQHLRNDFSCEKFQYVKYASGKKNKLLFAILRCRCFILFDFLIQRV